METPTHTAPPIASYLLAVFDAANAQVMDGYQIAKDTLPDRVALMANGLRSFAADRKILREENWRLREALEKFREQVDKLGCTGTAETALESLEPEQEDCACHEKGWENKWTCAVEMAAQAECKLDGARKMHAYANEQRKAADNARMNAEETVTRLRARVDELLKHGKDACEYTDGWNDALLKVRDEFPPENAIAQTRAQKESQ